MNTQNKNSFFKTLFFPLLMLFNLMGISAVLLQKAGLLMSSPDISLLAHNSFVSIGFSILFILFVSRFPMRVWLPKALLCFAMLMAGSLVLLVSEKTASYFCFIASIFTPTFFYMLAWALVNQIAHFTEGMKYYIPLAFCSGLGSLPLSFLSIFNTRVGLSPPWKAALFISGAVLFILLALMVARLIVKKVPEERWQQEVQDTSQKMPILKIGFAMAALGLLNCLLDPLFKNQLALQYPTAFDYSAFMGHHSMLIGSGVLMISLLSLLLIGPFILKQKGWRFTALIAPSMAFVATSLFIFGVVMNFYPLPLGSAFQFITKGFKMCLLLPLIQMFYLALPQTLRFKTQGWAELVIAPLLLPVCNAIVQSLLVSFGTIAAISPYLMGLSLLIAGTLIAVIYSLGKRTNTYLTI